MNPQGLLLDTHVLIWFVEGKLSPATVAMIVDSGLQRRCRYSPVTAWEAGLLARPNRNGVPRYQFDPDPMRWYADLGKVPYFEEAPLTAEILIASSQLPGEFHADPADRMLVAAARSLSCDLVTNDAAILAYAKQRHVKAIPC